MAEARLEPPVPTEQQVVLTMSQDEAKTLLTVLAKVSTHSDFSTYPVYSALVDAGVRRDHIARVDLAASGGLVKIDRKY